MNEKIFLEENRNEFSSNVENAIDIALSTKTRLLPNNDLVDDFSLFKQYNKERDECNKFRLILTVNPICSNVLFNKKTEVVIDEGSDKCIAIRDNKQEYKIESSRIKNVVNSTPITYMQTIRDTEYTHKDMGGFVYHCGADIFNNHMLRKKEFVHINKINPTSQNLSKPVYNTIFDYKRDGEGNIVEEKIHIDTDEKSYITKMHLYQYDNIMSMPLAFADNCFEKDGWWGFTNPNTIEIENTTNKNISLNRMMANNKPCEFIDLYPDRSLYSFVPKYNKFRLREERNWDYCITYPYATDVDAINKVCGGENAAIKANIKYGFNTSSIPVVECSSYFKHNLKNGDYVTFFYYMPNKMIPHNVNYKVVLENNEYKLYKEGEETPAIIIPKTDLKFTRYSVKVKVQNIGDVNGDNKDRVFNVRFEDIQDIYHNMLYFGCFYKKNTHNTDCLYYFRKFKKLKNINETDLKSDINKVAFAKNIYGDEMAQVVFTDDVNINGLLDHNGKPVSEIFFTIIKRNKGYEKWYSDKSNVTDAEIEFSHCFGKVTSAVDFCGIENEPFDYNIHYLHNINKPSTITPIVSNTFEVWGDTVLMGTPKVLEDDITVNFDEFYGDIVEYDICTANETVIGNVYHRFNTAQRECWNTDFMNLYQDLIVSDDYDAANGTGNPFKIATYYINDTKSSVNDVNNNKDMEDSLIYANISPEGYYYNPHIKIAVKKNNDITSTAPAKLINYNVFSFRVKETFLLRKEDGTIIFFDNEYDAFNSKEEGDDLVSQGKFYEVMITAPVNYGFYKGDYIAFYNNKSLETSWGEITSVSGNDITIKFDNDVFSTIPKLTSDYFSPISGKRCLYAFWSPNNVPVYARLSEGLMHFVWKSIVPPSEMVKEDELYDLPFTNGRFYIEKNVTFFLKRQDPIGKYGLSYPLFKRYTQKLSNPMLKYRISGYKPIDFSEIMYTINNTINTCF